MRTYNDVYQAARKALLAAGIEAAATEARAILAAAADKSPADFLRDLRLYPGGDFEARAETLIRRRLAGEPAAYLAGSWEFYGLELEVNPNVLIPRSDTEAVTGAAIAFLENRREARVLDLCTGSGCIGLAIAHEVPDARVVLADIDRRALMLAKRNAQRLHLGARVAVLETDVMLPPARQLGSFDLIVANPPYVPSGEMEGLDSSVRDWEPWTALDGGEDGLDFFRAILGRWVSILLPGGCLALECGEEQAQPLRDLAGKVGLVPGGTFRDTGGTERALTFIKETI